MRFEQEMIFFMTFLVISDNVMTMMAKRRNKENPNQINHGRYSVMKR
jgi:hypothetical protein